MRVGKLPSDTGISGWNAVLEPYAKPLVPEGSITVDYLIIGGGFAGLSAARRLKQLRPNAEIALVDAKRIGEGPAGRNSGFMIDLPHELSSADYSTTPENDLRQIGLNRQAIAFAQSAASEYGMPDEALQLSGKINGAAGAKAVKHNEDYAKHLKALGEDYKLLDAREMARVTGTGFYTSGLYTPGTAMLQPALYVRSLADSMKDQIALYENTPIIKLDRQNRKWIGKTERGQISAAKVILAVNGHVQHFGHFERKIFHVILYASMTRALNDDEALFTGEPAWGITPSDPMATTMRKISGMGGTRIVTRNRMTYAPSLNVSEKMLSEMIQSHHEAFNKRYPDLKHVEQEYSWAGRLCMSRNSAPAFGEVNDGLYSACCQNGLGTAKGTLSGMAVAELATEGETELARALMEEGTPQRLPPAPFDSIGAKAFMRWGEYKARGEL